VSELDDRFDAAMTDPALAPTPVEALHRRAGTRARRRDLATATVCALVAVLGIASFALRIPDEPASLTLAEAGPTGTPLGVRGSGEVSLSCVEVGVDVQAAQSGLAFIGTPVEARLAPPPTVDQDALPSDAASRVIWTFEVETVVKGAAPKRLDVTVEWLDDAGRPLGPRDPVALFEAARGRQVGVLADRLGESPNVVARTTCSGYTVPIDAIVGLPFDDAAPADPPGPAVALAAIGPMRGTTDRAIVALDAEGEPIAYGEGPGIDALASCPESTRAVSIDASEGTDPSVVVWDTTTLEPVRIESLPPPMEEVGAWVLGCLDADADRIAITQVANHTRIAVRSREGAWAVSDEHERVAAAVVLSEPQVVLLASSVWGPTLTTVDLATLATVGEASLGDTGDIVGGAPSADGSHAELVISNGVAPPGAAATGGRIITVAPDGQVVRTIELTSRVEWEGPARPIVFPAPDGSVSAWLLGVDATARAPGGVVTFAGDGRRVGIQTLGFDDLDRVLWVGVGRVWTVFGSVDASDDSAPADGSAVTASTDRDRKLWPFAATAVVGLDVPIAIDPAATGRVDPYDALDAGFAAAVDPPRLAAPRRSPLPTVAGVVLLGLAIIGVLVILARRRRRRVRPNPAADPVTADDPSSTLG
jgi:hypothetical protein